MNFFPTESLPALSSFSSEDHGICLKQQDSNCSFHPLFQKMCGKRHSPSFHGEERKKLGRSFPGKEEKEEKDNSGAICINLTGENLKVVALSLVFLLNHLSMATNEGKCLKEKGISLLHKKDIPLFREEKQICEFLGRLLKSIEEKKDKELLLRFQDKEVQREFLNELKEMLSKGIRGYGKRIMEQIFSSLEGKGPHEGPEDGILLFHKGNKRLLDTLLSLAEEGIIPKGGADSRLLREGKTKFSHGPAKGNSTTFSSSREGEGKEEVVFSSKEPPDSIFFKARHRNNKTVSGELDRGAFFPEGENFSSSVHNGKKPSDYVNRVEVRSPRTYSSVQESIEEKSPHVKERLSKTPLKDLHDLHEKMVNPGAQLKENIFHLGEKTDTLQNGYLPSTREEILRQIENGIMRHLPGGKRELEIQLHPPELGRVKVNITVRNKEVSLLLRVEHTDVAKSLNQHLAGFENSFEKQGLKLVKIEIRYGFGDGESPSWMGFNQQRGEHGRGNAKEMRRVKFSRPLTLVGEGEIENLRVEGIKNPLSAIYLIA